MGQSGHFPIRSPSRQRPGLSNIVSQFDKSTEPSPDSGVSEPDSGPRILHRRKTLALPEGQGLGIQLHNGNARLPANGTQPSGAIAALVGAGRKAAAPGLPAPSRPNAFPPPSRPMGGGGLQRPLGTLRKSSTLMGSMPDVASSVSTTSTMPREEVHLLSLKRREEIRRQREAEERRREQEIVLRLGDIKVCFLVNLRKTVSWIYKMALFFRCLYMWVM